MSDEEKDVCEIDGLLPSLTVSLRCGRPNRRTVNDTLTLAEAALDAAGQGFELRTRDTENGPTIVPFLLGSVPHRLLTRL